MKFPYRREPSAPNPAHKQRTSILRPRIRIRLLHGNRYMDLLALVDSGADDCVFPIEVAQDLNLTLDPQKAHRYRGIGSGHITAYFAHVTLEIGGFQMPIYAGFSDAPSIAPILGQGEFFDRFEVKFNRPQEVIELRPLKS